MRVVIVGERAGCGRQGLGGTPGEMVSLGMQS